MKVSSLTSPSFILVRQKYRPKIKIKHKKLSSNENLEATCQSAPAHPAPHLTWFINHMKVYDSFIKVVTNEDIISIIVLKTHTYNFDVFIRSFSDI